MPVMMSGFIPISRCPGRVSPARSTTFCKTRVEKGDQYVEVYEYDLNGGLKGGTINDATFIAERLLLLGNLP